MTRAALGVAVATLVAGAVALGRAATVPLGGADVEVEAVMPAPLDNATTRRASEPGQLEAIIAGNVFTSTRQPPGNRYGVQLVATPDRGAPASSLLLVGLVLGHPGGAVLKGVPNAPGDRVVAVGDTVAGYRLAALLPDHVLLVAVGDTLRLRFREVR